MAVDKQKFLHLTEELKPAHARLVAVSKTKPPDDILALYRLGQRDFGENYVQELAAKEAQLPKRYPLAFHRALANQQSKRDCFFCTSDSGVDSFKLLVEIDRQAQKNGRIIDVLLQVHIAREETKFGLDEEEVHRIMATHVSGLHGLQNIQLKGLMGMASFTADKEKVREEFACLKSLFDKFSGHLPSFTILSMGMSGDYGIALAEGSNMIRVGSLLFGERTHTA